MMNINVVGNNNIAQLAEDSACKNQIAKVSNRVFYLREKITEYKESARNHLYKHIEFILNHPLDKLQELTG
jgi:hypothetical protein